MPAAQLKSQPVLAEYRGTGLGGSCVSGHAIDDKTVATRPEADRMSMLERRVKLLTVMCAAALFIGPAVTLLAVKAAAPVLGVAGPVGPAGQAGPRGEAGAQGPAVRDGQVPTPQQVASVLLPQQCTTVEGRFVQLEDAATDTGFPETMRVLTCRG